MPYGPHFGPWLRGGGLDGAAMSAVAEEAGVATGTAYNHYSSKEDLVIAAAADCQMTVESSVFRQTR